MAHDQKRSKDWRKILSLLFLPLLADCGRTDPSLVRFNGLTMGTSYSVKVVESASSNLATGILHGEIARLLAGIEERMSVFEPSSEISRFNDFSASGWYEVSPDTAEVVGLALEIGRETGGAFDITVAPLVDLWGFGPGREPGGVPTKDELGEVLPHVEFSNLSARKAPAALRKTDPALRVDLGGIAKGYGVDRVSELLESRGIRRYLVEIGGEVRASGFNARGAPWKIGIAAPSGSGLDSVLRVDLAAVATSGDGHSAFVSDGKRYSHLIDPGSGEPSAEASASVTVVDRSCARADGLATALAVLGIEKGFELALKNGWAAYFIHRDEDTWTSRMTPAFAAVIEVETIAGNEGGEEETT